jgi:hypothetical protein
MIIRNVLEVDVLVVSSFIVNDQIRPVGVSSTHKIEECRTTNLLWQAQLWASISYRFEALKVLSTLMLPIIRPLC